MHVMILGAAGMLGQKLAAEIAAAGQIAGQQLQKLTLVDMVAGTPPAGVDIDVSVIAANLGDAHECERLAALAPDVVFHLAAVVSSEAEANFALGYDVNVRATWNLLDALAATENRPRFIFASSLAVYGAPFPDHVPEDFAPKPKSSYGVQKLIIEQLLADYTRKGFLRGVSLRLPTIVIRPGKPNAAASSFLSGILREPLNGARAVLPVADTTKVWIAPPTIAINGLIHAANIAGEPEALNAINLPGLSISIGDMLTALERHAGAGILDLIDRAKDETVARIVSSWPGEFSVSRATDMGFSLGVNIGEIIGEYVVSR